MSFITQSGITSSSSPQNLPVTVQANSAGPYFAGTPYTWTITNFDSYVTYTATATNGTASQSTSTITYTPSTAGAGGYVINLRPISLTISAITAWFATLSNANTNYALGGCVDGSDNVFTVGQGSTVNCGRIAKYSSTGALQWQYQAGSGVSTLSYRDIVAVGSDFYVSGQYTFNGYGAIDKYNNSGIKQSGVYLNSSNGFAIDTDGSDLYVCGSESSPTNNYIAKLNTSLVIQWQYTLSATNDTRYLDIVVDGSNVYAVGRMQTVNTGSVAKYSTAGVIQWQRTLAATGDEVYFYGVDKDSSANIYAGGTAENAFNALLVKYDSTGTLQWQRTITGTNYTQWYAVKVNGSDIYACGYSIIAGAYTALIAKYDSTGTLQWQRNITGLTLLFANKITINSAGKLVVFAYFTVGGVIRMFTLSVPNDGSATGTYTVGGQSFTYGVSTLTSGTSTYTSAAGTMINAVASLTANPLSTTDAASTLTAALTQV